MGTVTTYVPLIASGISLFLAWEDIRTRSISLWGLLIFGICGLVEYTAIHGFRVTFDLQVNVGFVLLIWGMLWLYSISRKKGKLMSHWLGWGDILFLFVVTPWFSFPTFLAWYLLSLGLALLITLIMRLISPNPIVPTIPLVTYFSMGFVAILILTRIGLVSFDQLWLR